MGSYGGDAITPNIDKLVRGAWSTRVQPCVAQFSLSMPRALEPITVFVLHRTTSVVPARIRPPAACPAAREPWRALACAQAASEGAVVFDRAYVQQAICCPTRSRCAPARPLARNVILVACQGHGARRAVSVSLISFPHARACPSQLPDGAASRHDSGLGSAHAGACAPSAQRRARPTLAPSVPCRHHKHSARHPAVTPRSSATHLAATTGRPCRSTFATRATRQPVSPV